MNDTLWFATGVVAGTVLTLVSVLTGCWLAWRLRGEKERLFTSPKGAEIAEETA